MWLGVGSQQIQPVNHEGNIPGSTVLAKRKIPSGVRAVEVTLPKDIKTEANSCVAEAVDMQQDPIKEHPEHSQPDTSYQRGRE